jgi:hypothetical protein
VSELDDGWFSKQTGAESDFNRPESEPANYSTSIDITSFQSIGSNFSLEELDYEGECDGELRDSFECQSPTLEERKMSEQEDYMFLDRMETAMFSYENKLLDDSIATYESDESSVYDGEPRDENYFGEEARTGFFALYHRYNALVFTRYV